MNWTPKREREIAERCEKAIPGPWMHDREAHHARNRLIESADVTMMDEGKVVSWLQITAWNGRDARPTADFIAHARTDLPDVLSELKRLREENERLKVMETAQIVDRAGLEDHIEYLKLQNAALREVIDAARSKERGEENG